MPDYKYIYVQPLNKVWRPGIKIIPSKYSDRYSDFLEFMAETARDEIVKIIDTQRYKYRWPPLSFGYYQYKKKNNLSLNIWEASSFLKDNLDVIHKVDYLILGFEWYAVYPKTLVPAINIAKKMEFGCNKTPPRPLFRLAIEYLNKHVRRYWEKFKKEEGLK